MITCDFCPRQERCRLDPNRCSEMLARECVGKMSRKGDIEEARIMRDYNRDLSRRILQRLRRRYYR